MTTNLLITLVSKPNLTSENIESNGRANVMEKWNVIGLTSKTNLTHLVFHSILLVFSRLSLYIYTKHAT
jgi:hypothetical protein